MAEKEKAGIPRNCEQREAASYMMERVLRRESELLDRILNEQQNLRQTVKSRQWDNLMQTISILSMLADEFNNTDSERDILESSISLAEANALSPLRTDVKTKLMRSKASSQALNEYITVTNNFVHAVMDEAADSGSANVYDRDGKYTHSNPRSVLVDCQG